jgi:hypothetical protein
MIEVISKNMLTEKELQILSYEYNKKSKSIAVSYILFIFLGILLIHRIYNGSTPYSVFLLSYILFCISGFLASIFLMFFSDLFLAYSNYMDMKGGARLFLLPFAWILVDVFRIPSIVNSINNKLEQSILKKIVASRG